MRRLSEVAHFVRMWLARVMFTGSICVLGRLVYFFSGRMSNFSRQDSIRRLLLIRLDQIGDVVLTIPVLRNVRQQFPRAQVTVLVSPPVAEVVAVSPYVNKVLTFDSDKAGLWHRVQFAYRHLWPQRFDVTIVPNWGPDNSHSGLMAFLSGARQRLGYSESVKPRNYRFDYCLDWYYTKLLKDGTPKHEVEKNIEILRLLNIKANDIRLETWVTQADEAWALSCLNAAGALTDRLIAICPGSNRPSKNWPVSHFIELGRWLIQNCQARLVLIGASSEHFLGRQITAELGIGALDLIGRTTLRQTCALLSNCLLYIGNDTGPMHLAAARGVPVIEISKQPRNSQDGYSESPVRFGPWGVPHRILQPDHTIPPCLERCTENYGHCITGVSVQMVQEAVKNLSLEFGWEKPAEIAQKVHIS